jgi:haloalkane dehalogenase
VRETDGVEIFRTPDERFTDLPDFPYEPRYVDVPDGDGGGELRIAYVEDGPLDGPVVLLLHGEPTWSFLYRSMLPVLAGRGLRAIALDLVGFGRSDKPATVADHSYARHVEWVRAAVLDALDLHDVTLVGQDWGGLIGLRLATENPDRFARIVAANTGLPTGDHPMPEIWWAFRQAVETAPTLDVGRLVASGCARGLSDEARRAYDAPFPDETFKAGPRAMPLILPTTPDDPATGANRQAWQRLTEWTKPFLVAFSDRDPITGPMGPVLTRAVPTARDRPQPTIAGAGHFLQEDAGKELAVTIADFILDVLPENLQK